MSDDDRNEMPNPEDDILNIELDDLDDEPAQAAEPAPLPPLQQPATDAGTLVIDLEDLDDEPAASAYPPAAPSAAYPAVDAGAGYDLYAKTKKDPIAALFGNLMLQMLIAGLIGGLLAWIANEPWFGASDSTALGTYAVVMIFTAIAGSLIGAALGVVEGLLSAAYLKALKDAGLGLLIGAVGGALAGGIAQFAFALIVPDTNAVTVRLIIARTIGWALAGLGIGLAQGVRYFNFSRILNGLIGGAIGGFVGGILFDVVGMILAGGAISRLVGLAVIGAATGAAIGLLEEIRKQAWITIVEGPLTGKEYILFKQVTTIGSAPHCDIPLFKDPDVATEHAHIQQSGNAFIIASRAGPEAVFVNGRPATNQPLKSGDLLHLGSTAFYYQDRALDAAAPPPQQ